MLFFFVLRSLLGLLHWFCASLHLRFHCWPPCIGVFYFEYLGIPAKLHAYILLFDCTSAVMRLPQTLVAFVLVKLRWIESCFKSSIMNVWAPC
jgi:hypothetical protein